MNSLDIDVIRTALDWQSRGNRFHGLTLPQLRRVANA